MAAVDDYCRDVGGLLDRARERITVYLYLMRYSEEEGCPEVLVRKLAEAKRRGVEVTVFLEDVNYNSRAVEYLTENNVPVLFLNRFLHAKFILVDNCYVVGSHNWTWSAMHRNVEASVIVCDGPVPVLPS